MNLLFCIRFAGFYIHRLIHRLHGFLEGLHIHRLHRFVEGLHRLSIHGLSNISAAILNGTQFLFSFIAGSGKEQSSKPPCPPQGGSGDAITQLYNYCITTYNNRITRYEIHRAETAHHILNSTQLFIIQIITRALSMRDEQGIVALRHLIGVMEARLNQRIYWRALWRRTEPSFRNRYSEQYEPIGIIVATNRRGALENRQLFNRIIN